MVGKLGPNTNKGLGFWTAEPSVVLTYPPDLTKIFRPIYRSLPDQPAQQLPPTWTQNLLQGTLRGQDKLPPGKLFYDLVLSQRPPEQVQLHSWVWSYNLNLIGKDKLPVGAILTDRPFIPLQLTQTWIYSVSLALTFVAPVVTQAVFRGIYRSLPDQPATPALLWSAPNLVLTATPFRQIDWPIPTAVRQPAQSFTASYNLNLIGKDQLPAGEIVIDLTPRPNEYHAQLRTWAWSYNLNLIGKDRLPSGEIITDRPQLLPPSLFQTWINAVNLALVTVPPLPRPPFNQFDWPLTPAPGQPAQSWTASYNQNLIGQDQLPNRQRDWPLPGQPADGRTWIQSVNLALITVAPLPRPPFNQFDWPLTPAPQQPAQSWAWSYNQNLIGQDRLPVRQMDWPLTPAPQRATELSTWLDRVKLLLAVPFKQTDWPVPPPLTQPDRGFVSSYNRNLIGQDRLPNRQQDWPLTQSATAAVIQTWIQSVNLALLVPAVIGPLGVLFNQYSWPLTPLASQPDRGVTVSYNLNLIGQDRLPSRQTDWPLPNRGPVQPDRGFSFFNPNYYPPTPPPPPTGMIQNLPFFATPGQLMNR